MKFLVDESAGIGLSQFLNKSGHNSVYIAEGQHSGAEDRFVLAKARRENRIIVTNDKDFGELIFYQKLNTYGIILLRLSDESVENKIRIFKELLPKYSKKIRGNFIVANEDKIRIRKI